MTPRDTIDDSTATPRAATKSGNRNHRRSLPGIAAAELHDIYSKDKKLPTSHSLEEWVFVWEQFPFQEEWKDTCSSNLFRECIAAKVNLKDDAESCWMT